jgi:hypothetical protein
VFVGLAVEASSHMYFVLFFCFFFSLKFGTVIEAMI